jgi:hypothetical protein
MVLWTTLVIGSTAAPVSGTGIYSWAGWHPRQVSRTECPELRGVPLILHWKNVEPAPGEYRFEKLLREPLEAAHAQDLAVTAMIWVGPAAPDWLYKAGVPEVFTDRDVDPLGRKMSKENNRFPYYFSPVYKERFFKLVEAFGAYVAALPPELHQRIVLVQSCEGSTGDGQPFKGAPLDDEFAIPKDAWNAFRLETWKHYQATFPGLPILVNSDANGADQQEWLLEHMDVIALKHGMFSHGYHVSDNRTRLASFQALEAAAGKHGKPVLTRGEMDGEMFVYGWSTRNIPQGLYWSGLMATHCRLDIWNIPHKALKDPANRPAFAFFNKHAGHRDPATTPGAFCALRDGLDASDFVRFPAAEFGGKPGRKRDKDRYLKIAMAFANHGARMDDPDKALGGGMLNRKRSGSNDVGWGILPGNYSRFLTQIDPGSGDVGWWNIDDSIHGRFARGFDHQAGKTRMRFVLDPAFFGDPGIPHAVTVSITWLDKGTGAWSLRSWSADGQGVVMRIRNKNSGKWVTKAFALDAALFPGTPKRPELTLQHEDGGNTLFHLIELERNP